MSGFIAELKRRQVIKSAGIYIVFAWVLLQVADVVVPAAGWPEWVVTFVLYLMILGFPFTLLLAWMFDLTRKGVEREQGDSGKKPLKLTSPAILLSLVVFAGGAYLAYQKALPPPDLTPSIAVIPFENLTGDASQDFLSDGITEEIMNNLFRLKNFKVIARTSVYAVKELNLELAEIGSRLGVENILEGNLQINEDAIRLAVRMINVATGKPLWSETFDGKLSDFEFQDHVTQTVIDAVSVVFGREAPAVKKVATREVQAREHFLRANYYIEQRGPENIGRAAGLYQQAIDVDPLYADAWAGLGAALFFGGGDDVDIEVNDRRVDAVIGRALEYDPENAHALTVQANLAGFRNWDFGKAISLSQQAVELAPGSGDARHFHAIMLGMAGRHEDSLAEQKIAASLNPLYPPLLEGVGHRLRYMWRFEESTEFYKQSIKNGFERTYDNLFYAYCNLGRLEEAAKILLRDGRQTELDDWDRMVLAYFGGELEEAAQIYQEHLLTDRPPASEFHVSPSIDAAYAGDFDYAFESMMVGAEQKNINLIRILRSRRLSDEFYSDPRWVELWNHPHMKPLFELHLKANETPWIPIMNAAIAEREARD